MVLKYHKSLRTLVTTISIASEAILSALSTALQLRPENDLCKMHRVTKGPSPHLVRLLRYHAQPVSESRSSHVEHTDMGSLTFLFARQRGLQVRDPSSRQWQWVEPPSRGGAAADSIVIVNVGDTLSYLTGQRLRSCQHRVIPWDEQERYSFAYFMRADNDTPMKVLESPVINNNNNSLDKVNESEKNIEKNDTIPQFGKSTINHKEDEVIPCSEWMRRKYTMLRRDTWTPEQNWILTGTPTKT